VTFERSPLGEKRGELIGIWKREKDVEMEGVQACALGIHIYVASLAPQPP